jgi:glycosyltransferase involved in cell wall biosynthesis
MDSNKKRILVLSVADKLGGAEQILQKVIRHHISNGDLVDLFFLQNMTNESWGNEELNGLKIIYFNGNILNLVIQLLNYQYFRAYSSHISTSFILGLLRTFNLLKTKQLVVRESTNIFERYSGFKLLKYKLAYWIGYNKIDLVITQTQIMGEILLKKVPYLQKRVRIVTIPNPFEFPINPIIPVDDTIKGEYIVSAGRFIPEKGFDLLLTAYSNIKKKYPDLKLVLLGDGRLKDNLLKIVEDLNIRDGVCFLGFVENVYPYFQRAQVCVVSSRVEGFPNVLLQMMSQNDRVVSTICAGDIDRIKGIVTCTTNDVKALEESILKCLRQDVSMNRTYFEAELKSRTIENFMNEIEYQVL